MNLFQKPIDSAIQLAKTASKSCSTRKTIGCFAETIGCLYQQTTNKLNLKSQRQRDCTQLFILVHSKPELHPVFSETLRISTKQSPLDHLHHNQENDLEHLQETHSPWPTLRLLILNTSRTHNQSQQHTQTNCSAVYKDYTCYRWKFEINTSRIPFQHLDQSLNSLAISEYFEKVLDEKLCFKILKT